jgi:hypothetical protein
MFEQADGYGGDTPGVNSDGHATEPGNDDDAAPGDEAVEWDEAEEWDGDASVQDLRQKQLAELACEQDDNAECAAADLFHEFPP